MSNKVTTPYPLFSDIDGAPLDAGFVFIGESGKDPELFPVPLFWDKEQTQPAVQPIRTRNGYFVQNEDKAQLYSNALKCSMRVKNRNSTPVYEEPQLLFGTSASSVEDSSGQSQQDINNTLVGLLYAPDFPTSRFRVIAGAIRNTGTGWQWIQDSAHTPVGIEGAVIEASGISIKINYGFTAKRVVSLQVVTDETFSALGITCGPSVGNSFTNINIAAPLEFDVNFDTGVVTAPSYRGNYITSNVVNGARVIGHPKVEAGTVFSASKVGSVTTNHSDLVVSSGTTQLTIYGGGNIDGKLTYNGTQWTYSGEMRTPPTVSYDSATGELTITHTTCDANVNVTPMFGGLTARLSDYTGTTIKVKFLDATGAAQTTITAGTAFTFSRKANVPKTRLSGLYSFHRGYAAIDAKDLISETGNFWILGIMEV